MRLNQITAPTTDLAASAAFYKALGFRQIVAADHYARFEAPDGDATFSLHLQERMPDGDGVVIYLEDEALDETVRRLQALGVVFDSGPEDKRWLWREARLSDPCGNRICLYFAGENRLNPPWRLTDGAATA